MKQDPNTNRLTFEYLLQKAEHFCAWRERCNAEVADKLRALGASPLQQQKVMEHLEENGFLDTTRFAMSFVRGKLNNNHWGRIRLGMELRHRQIPPAIIEHAMQQIDTGEYWGILEKEALKKAASLKQEDPFTRNGKIAAYCIHKGFEPDLVWQLMKEQFGENQS